MASVRKPLQGVYNIIRFNWPFYVWAIVAVFILIILKYFILQSLHECINILILIIVVPVSVSLLISLYVYDLSPLYSLNWSNDLNVGKNKTIINIHAGFDETSILLDKKFPDNELIVYDFYDPAKHTEASIKRARKIYPAFVNTLPINTSAIPLQNNTVDFIFLIFAAHEIRNNDEKIIFFKELNRVIKPKGEIIITEHLRDAPNFLAYNIGFFHFFGKHAWSNIFKQSNFVVAKQVKITPFVTAFILKKNGSAS